MAETGIKVGDKYKLYDGSVGEITAVGRVYALIEWGNSNESPVLPSSLVDPTIFTKIEPFFEVGKTYKRGLIVFECQYIGELIEGGITKDRVAFGPMKDSFGFYWQAFDVFSDWTEVSNG